MEVGSPFAHAPDDLVEAFEERAAIRQHDGGEGRTEAEAAAIKKVALRARLMPDQLRLTWADHADAQCYYATIAECGPLTFEAGAASLGWPLARAWKAEARLRAAGLVQFDDRTAMCTATRSIHRFGGVFVATPRLSGSVKNE